MNKHALLHIPDSSYCFATKPHELVIRLRTAKEDTNLNISLVYGPKYGFQTKQHQKEMNVGYEDELYRFYEIKLTLEDVRLAYVFCLKEKGETYYFSEDGITKTYNFMESFYNFFQMPYINENDIIPRIDWTKGAVFYQIFVDRFYQGNTNKDMSYINLKWGELPTPKSFAGGDLRGIIDKLEYLKELGITAIYLTPIFESISNHKYDIKDYKKIDPQFGTLKDFKELVEKAHKKGMYIVLDAVFNHCSMDMEQFADVQKKGRTSEFYDWFLIQGDFPNPEKLNYECFGSCNYMPKLNTANRKVQDFLIEIALYWMKETNIDGWRLDVSDEVSHEFWRRFRKKVKEYNEKCIMIGENWHDAYPYLMGDQYDSIMNYSFTKACLDYFAKGTFGAKEMAEKLNRILMRNKEPINDMMLNLLDSHDTHRFYTEVENKKDRLLSAIALEMIFPGIACLYYGTECCMQGGYDPDSRRCFPWDDHENEDVFRMIQTLSAMKKDPILTEGSVYITEEDDMLLVKRIGKGSISLYINLTKSCKIRMLQKNEKILAASGMTDTIVQKDKNIKTHKSSRQILEQETYEILADGFVVIKEGDGI